ncbi:putative Ig domain-containing protein [Kitasatospora sp. YST-16]|uniref:putative Ig domain-containing protein n=1 Tax=unclassified Kitasatospora TaxID=2633591 RepID=UPI0004C36237|nr:MULTISPECIES: putative Ig domain-containing protein [unclassified Kitasatospora]WAL75535.1 putative Ig domain-containing protein [Kitasatospora sp. YST-16]WNW41601.1 putative Ig domain-containing protein [Streptomyces sp. Li-HN-5-13]
MIRASKAARPAALAATGLVLAAMAATVPSPGAAAATTATTAAVATPKRVLFDNTKGETAGNADWIISTSQPDPLAQNANPSTETSWTGAISAWGVALQKTGNYSLKTLPAGNTITYGTGGALDLANFDEFVLPEPNIRLSDAEKTAVMKFVQNGGGLFLISDHTQSDRNNDGWDSPAIINDLLTTNSVDSTDPFGFSVDLLNITTDNPRAITDSTDPVLNGPFGKVTGSIIRNGTTFTLKPADNPNVKGLLYRTGYSGSTGAAFATSTFGSGRVAIWGDSSPIDDGTGQSGNTLYNGWDDPAGTDAALALNATAWLAQGSGGGTTGSVSLTNPGTRTATAGTATSLQLAATDTAGGTLAYSATGLPAGLTVNATTGLISGTPTTAGSYSVTAKATDSTGPSATAAFTWTVNPAGGGTGCTAAQLITNPGFETGSTSGWTETNSGGSSTINSSSSEPAHSGSYDAWLDGYGAANTDTLAQTVTLPAGCSNYNLSFWLHIDSASSTTTVFDTLTVTANGTTVAGYNNTNAAAGYQQRTVNLAAYAGQSVTLKFTGTEDYTKQTSFVLDDVNVNVS